LFLEACGSKGSLELRIEHPARPRPVRWVLHQPFALLGRESQADVSLADKEVTPRHAYLQVLGGRPFCVDLRGRPDVPEGTELGQSDWVTAGAWHEVGPVRLGLVSPLLDEAGPHGDPMATAACDEHLLPSLRLEFLHETVQTPPWRMTRLLALIGRSTACKVRLRSMTISRIHCSLVRTPMGAWVVDLGGRGGISVNGARVRFALLEEGDELQVGEFTVRVHYASPSDLAQPPEPPSPYPLPHDGGEGRVRGALTPAPNAFSPPRPLPPQFLETGQVNGALLVPLFNQFALMQQQMFDQFQQALVTTVQTFGSMHKEQLGLVREELDRLHDLTRELHVLQDELARHKAGTAAPTPRPTAAPTPRPAVAPAPPAREASAIPASPPERKRVEPTTPPPATKRPVPAAAEQGPPSEEVHVWLTRRIAAIHEERQSLWNRVVSMFRGGQPG
jgi:hypothetical protein